MQMLPLYSKRAPTAAGAFCLLLATLLSGCASKNPLMEDPAPIASTAKAVPAAKPAPEPEVIPAAKTTEEKPATPSVPAGEPAAPAAGEIPQAVPQTQAAPASTGGIQVKQEKRFLGFFRPYRPDIQQGNFISQEMVAQLKEGMTQDQVIFLLGTPLLNDVFHADRWDYAFRMQKGDGQVTSSRVTVFFKDKRVTSFEGTGDLPTEADYLARIADKAKAAKNK
jgi:outer membrane protein assembly factor BamE